MQGNTSWGVLSILLLPFLLSLVAPMASAVIVQEEPTGLTPEDIWSEDYANWVYPWGNPHNDQTQFKEYHDYFTMKERMQQLAEQNPDIIEFHEGLNGGINARGDETTADSYEGWYYGHSSPWVKITGDVQGGGYNAFNGDHGNYEDREDVMLVGNHHAREWMSYEVPMFFLEILAFSYNNIGYDNDGDGLVDEDPWDGIDNDGDCHALDPNVTWTDRNNNTFSNQDSNGDGLACGPGDLGVDEDYSEQWITDMVNNREIYLIPMLNVDGNRYDREVFSGPNAWDTNPTGGWRKNLRDNTFTGVTPIPDVDEQVDEGCDGVDLNRNYQFEWGAPLGATGPLFPGFCYASGPNNDVYNGPVDTVDNDGDFRLNEDHVDGKDDDADGLIDEDWLGGNSEPETKFIQDLTEMNDDNADGASEFKATLTWHSFSELVLYPWGHCQNCDNPDQEQLKYHGDWMAQLTTYENMQSSSLYPTTGDFCDWHYGVHGSYCYTMEIGTAFHQHPDDIDHIASLNAGVPFYMIEIADNPRERAEFQMARNHILQTPDQIMVPETGDIPIDICVGYSFPVSLNHHDTHVMYRTVKPTRTQSDYGPKEWSTTLWQGSAFEETNTNCTLIDNASGRVLRSWIPIDDTVTGQLHYKVMMSTLDGSNMIEYPQWGGYLTLDLHYRAAFGSLFGSLFLFTTVAFFVWGGLAVCLRMMMEDKEDIAAILIAELDEEGSA